MRFLVDECTGPAVGRWLRGQGHDVFSVYEEARGSNDDILIKKAYAENRIIVTNDKDFGEKVYREKYPHHGVILLRLEDDRVKGKIAALQRVLANHADRLADHFVVVTERAIRFAAR